MIVYKKMTTDASTNLLAGTDLATAPADGVLKVWGCSDQWDTVWTVVVGGNRIACRSIPLNYRSTEENEIDKDVPVVCAVRQGEQMIIQNTEVTAANMVMTAVFLSAGEVM